ncbi:putative secreted protein (Por secretion system target) [Lacibacter cauensis]|uniref:Putative secreted protein (Por secretion system target) n=1 Tax=Lacibacter cauensis TaxID=510947 RepID=A0A562SJC4_9BACT|nr:T9SS type A sorting domain-containing protein [Lacibacter cauensis]TWI81258.1 putative secreted protein (Por secretion system target) [Lacibacter cauensis]
MKIFYSFIIFSFIGLQAIAQQYWPHGSNPYPRCSTMTAPTCTKVAVGGDWDNANSWSPVGVPTQDQVVCIPAGVTINVKGPIYTASTACPPASTTASPRLQIFLCGTLSFQPSGKLYLACFSFIQTYSGGKITAANGSSDLIQIGVNIVWGGPGSGTQPDINGPWILSYPFTGAGVLTIGFDYFKVKQPQPYQVQLDWATTYEVNSDVFIVERSTDQKTWSSIGTIKSAGNSSQKQTYSFTDKAPVAGTAYYRLKQVDLKGEVAYSDVVRFNTTITKKFSLYPNPATTVTRLFSKEGFTAGQTIIILDAKGTVVRKINASGTNSLQLDLSNLANGLYLVQITERNQLIEKIPFVKQ